MSDIGKILEVAQTLKYSEISELIERLRALRNEKQRDTNALYLYPTAKNQRNSEIILKLINGETKADVARSYKVSPSIVRMLEINFYKKFKDHYGVVCSCGGEALKFHELLYAPILKK